MYLTSEESRNSLSDESIYSVTTTDLISFKEEVSSPENNVSIKNQTRPKRKREKLDHLSNEEKVGVLTIAQPLRGRGGKWAAN